MIKQAQESQTLPSLISSVDFFRKVSIRGDLAAVADRMIWEHRELYNSRRARDVQRARMMIRMHCTEWFRNPSEDKSPTQPNAGG